MVDLANHPQAWDLQNFPSYVAETASEDPENSVLARSFAELGHTST